MALTMMVMLLKVLLSSSMSSSERFSMLKVEKEVRESLVYLEGATLEMDL